MNEKEFKELVEEVRKFAFSNESSYYRNMNPNSNKTYFDFWRSNVPFLLEVNTGKYKGSIMRLRGVTTLDHEYEKNSWRTSARKKSGLIRAEVDERMGNRGKCNYVSYKRFNRTNETKTKLISTDIKVQKGTLDFFDRDLVAGDYVFGTYNNNTSFGIVKETATLGNENKVLVSFIKIRQPSYIPDRKLFVELKRYDKNESLKVWVNPVNLVKLDPLEFLQYDMK